MFNKRRLIELIIRQVLGMKQAANQCTNVNIIVILASYNENQATSMHLFLLSSRNCKSFILTSDIDECSFLNTRISMLLFYFISIFPSFFFELLRFDECYAINLPYFIV